MGQTRHSQRIHNSRICPVVVAPCKHGMVRSRVHMYHTLSTAASMKSVWNAPATASLTVMRALKSGLAICSTTSHAFEDPETA